MSAVYRAKKIFSRGTTGKKRNQMFVCDEIMQILNSY